MKCPICNHEIDDNDYWWGDRCLRCALNRQDVPVIIHGKPEDVAETDCACADEV